MDGWCIEAKKTTTEAPDAVGHGGRNCNIHMQISNSNANLMACLAVSRQGECAECNRHSRRLAGIGVENGAKVRRRIQRGRVRPESFHLQSLSQADVSLSFSFLSFAFLFTTQISI